MKLEHPYNILDKGQWLRGNLHTHTTRSDGDRPMQTVMDDYASRGYDFLMISDHDIYTDEKDYANYDAKSMLLIPGNEVTAHGVHILHVGADQKIEPHPQRQVVLSQIAETSGFSIIAHPDWLGNFNHCTIDQLVEWVGYTGIEIYNGTCHWHAGSAYGITKWDQLLSSGRHLWGYANDDHHGKVDDVALGWNMAYVTDHSTQGVLDALQRGRFYASTGITITDIHVTDMTIRIETDNASRIVALSEHGRRISQTNGSNIELKVPDDAMYVRFECWGNDEQFAWTQPFFVSD